MRLRCICGAPLVVMTQEQLSLEKKHNLRSGKRRPRKRDGHFVGFLSWTKCMGAWPFSNLWNLRVLSLMMHRHR